VCSARLQIAYVTAMSRKVSDELRIFHPWASSDDAETPTSKPLRYGMRSGKSKRTSTSFQVVISPARSDIVPAVPTFRILRHHCEYRCRCGCLATSVSYFRGACQPFRGSADSRLGHCSTFFRMWEISPQSSQMRTAVLYIYSNMAVRD